MNLEINPNFENFGENLVNNSNFGKNPNLVNNSNFGKNPNFGKEFTF